MIDSSSRCPEPELLASFIEGKLIGERLQMIAEHVNGCADCLFVMTETTRYQRERSAPKPQPVLTIRRPLKRWWVYAAAAAIAGAALLYVLPENRSSSNSFADAVRPLVDVTPKAGRELESRLTGGFAWSPIRRTTRSPSQGPDVEHMKVVGAAATVLERTAGDRSPAAQHARALALLLNGDHAAAIAILGPLAKSTNDAAVWSDLAAAQSAFAEASGDPSRLPQALAAADRAVGLAPRLAEAHFNRALVLQRLGLRDQAREAWMKFLEIDASSAWAVEARQRIESLKPRASFKDELQKNYARLAFDEATARALARRFPQETRVWTETEILARWAESERAGNRADAERHLRIARTFASEMERRNGDRLLPRAVDAIERSDSATRETLVDAHLAFRDAQRLYRDNRFREAEETFNRAAILFGRGRSPVALLAQYFETNTRYDQNEVAEARARLGGLLATAPPEYRAYRAQVGWQLGLSQAAEADWGASIDTLTTSAKTFDELGERNYATSVREILAQVHDQLGNAREAWAQRIIALEELGRTASTRLEVAIAAISATAAAEEDWPVAKAFLDLQVDIARRLDDPWMIAEAALLRAQLAKHEGDVAAARRNLEEADRAIVRLPDGDDRERAEAQRSAIAGLVAAAPGEAIAHLTKAIDFHSAKGRRMFLPELLLHRGRAWRNSGDAAHAAIDFEAGVQELERHRESVSPGEARWGIFDADRELFVEAVSLALERQDEETAFAYAERARARELLDAVRPGAPDHRSLDPGTLIVEYWPTERELVIFTADRRGVHALRVPVDRAQLVHQAAQFTQTVIDRASRHRLLGRTLHDLLLAPVAAEIAQSTIVVLVPGATLEFVPFAALVDGDGRYLVQSLAIVVAPSARVYGSLAARHREKPTDPHLLLVTVPRPASRDAATLKATQEEAQRVAQWYSRPTLLSAGDATSDVFLHAASSADIIHFAGHAIAGHGGGTASLLLAGDRTSERLDARRIAAMQLRRTSLVVLAACDTARGETLESEGTISVARAFLSAGVPTVLATLWPIDDLDAADFFPRIHEQLARGLAPCKALRAAQISAIERSQPPAVWAAVQDIGS